MSGTRPILHHLCTTDSRELLSRWHDALDTALPAGFYVVHNTTNEALSDMDFTVEHEDVGSVAAVEPIMQNDSPEGWTRWGVGIFGYQTPGSLGLPMEEAAAWLVAHVASIKAHRAARDAATRLGAGLAVAVMPGQ